MPELAEVETVRNTLKKSILGRKINHIDIFYPKMIENDEKTFKMALEGSSFDDIKRRGKYLIFELKDNYLISHLRMEGKFFIKNINEPKDKHEHLIFYFDDFTLRYHDTRKFGRMKVINKNEIEDYFAKVGPDANDENINPKDIYQKIHSKKLPIKELLLDQSIIAGLGNIYVDEVLYAAKINPLRSGCNISLSEVKDIIYHSKLILDKAINEKGTTIRSYTSSLGVYGNYQNFLKVHTKAGQKCSCGDIIKKIRVGGRGTYYCPTCQKR